MTKNPSAKDMEMDQMKMKKGKGKRLRRNEYISPQVTTGGRKGQLLSLNYSPSPLGNTV